MNNNKGYMWGVVGAIVIILLIVLFMRYNKKSDEQADTTQNTDTSVLTPGNQAMEDVSAGSVHAAVSEPKLLAYQDALVLYKDKRIQFDDTCQAAPYNVTFKNNVDLMLDNRSDSTRTMHLGFMGDISIKPWGFKIVNFSSAELPRAVVIDCGVQQNVAQVSLQK